MTTLNLDRKTYSTAVTLVSPGAVVAGPTRDGSWYTVRQCHEGCVLHLDAQDGLIAELEGRLREVPWQDEASRDRAILHIKSRDDLEPDLRDRLLRHVAGSMFYRDAAE